MIDNVLIGGPGGSGLGGSVWSVRPSEARSWVAALETLTSPAPVPASDVR